jgi:hypothetical protein
MAAKSPRHPEPPSLPVRDEDDPGLRVSGPPGARDIRHAGDDELGAVMAEALTFEGRVDRATHGFHTYPAGMHPDAAKVIIAACPGAVHDPFCGGGTVLLEAMLAGRKASGTDLSPIASLVTKARTADPALATPLRAASRRLAELARTTRSPVEVPEACRDWYEPHVAEEIGHLRDGIRAEDATVQPLLWAVLSSIVIKASYRESDTSNRKSPVHRPPGTTAILFHKKARELGRMIEGLPSGAEVLTRLDDARVCPPPPHTSLVLTSPPYPGVYDYLPMQQLRYAWLGIEPPGRAFSAEVGSRRSFRAKGRAEAFRDWREDTDRWIATQSQGLRRNGLMVVNVGDGLVGGRLVDALSPTVQAMRKAGLEIVARASADRPDHARNAVRIEHMVMGRKP